MTQSILSYGIIIWAGTEGNLALYNKLTRLQNKIVFNLFATNDDTIDNINVVYKRMKILNLPDLYSLRVCITIYKVINYGYAPFIIEQLERLIAARPYNTRNNSVFRTPFPRVNTIKMNFF